MSDSTKKRMPWRRVLYVALLVGAGAAMGATGMLGLLYNKPGRNLVWKVDRILDSRAGIKNVVPALTGGAWDPVGGFRVEAHATGLDFPVRIVFADTGRNGPDDPFYYVAELGGSIKVVTHGGAVEIFTEGLLNYTRGPNDELGLLGLAYDDLENQFFASMSYWDEDAGVFRNKVERLSCSEDGMRMTERAVILDIQSEPTVASYQIQFCALGPGGELYVGIGAGGYKPDAQNLDKFAGKIIRLNQDGSAVDTNPFYDSDAPTSARSYVYAYGFRNPFDIVWDPRNQVAYVSDVGPGIDRILRLAPGVNYCFEDDENQMRANALYTWGPGTGFAPVGMAIGVNDALGVEEAYRLYVGLFGQVHRPGPNDGKRITRFRLSPRGYLESGAESFIRYTGSRFASVVDVECGPDGIYFTDFYGDSLEPHAHGGVIYRVTKDPDWKPPTHEVVVQSGYARGKFLFYDNRCMSCHVLDGVGGTEGPDLSNARANLAKRLLAGSYDRWLDGLLARKGAYFRKYEPVYRDLMAADGTDRLRKWIHQHLLDPRFDNPRAKMPEHGFSRQDVESLATFLLKQ